MIWLVVVVLAVWLVWREWRGLRRIDDASVLLLEELGDDSPEILRAAERVRRAQDRREARRAWFAKKRGGWR